MPEALKLQPAWSYRQFDEAAYQQERVQELQDEFSTIYATLFLPGDLLAAAFSSGFIRVFQWRHMTRAWVASRQQERPCCQWWAHQGAVYSLSQAGTGASALMVSCGDDGHVCGWRLADIAAAADGEPQLSDGCLTPVFKHQLSVTPSGFGVMVSECPAAQALAVEAQRGHLYVGASDGGCTVLDLERLASSKPGSCSSSGDSGGGSGAVVSSLCAHIAAVLGLDYCAAAQQLASASEDGTVRLWDTRSGGCTAAIDPWNGVQVPVSSRMEQLRCLGGSSYVSCVRFDQSGSWVIAGNGTASLTLWSLTMGALAKQQTTGECVPQDLSIQPNKILMVGSDSHLYTYPFSLEAPTKSPISSSSAYCVDVEASSEIVATCGTHHTLDLTSQYGTRLGFVGPAPRV